MKQITEDFVSYETAILLKEKGFNSEPTRYYRVKDGIIVSSRLIKDTEGLRKSDDFDKKYIQAPSQSLALKWLREVHKLHIYAKPYWPQGDMRNKMSWQGFIVDLNTINGDSQCYADSYEEAIENRIKFALENLI